MTRCLAIILLVALLPAAAGCTVNPATGRQMVSLMSPAQEAQIGAQEHPRILEQFGGIYNDPELLAYVSRIGQSLTPYTERPEVSYTFTVLDSDVVNAFAVPGGYIYVTRGLLALANDEAELASVLAHELTHITARHSAERYSQATLAQLATGILGAATGSAELAQLAGLGAQLYLLSWSREQELEADTIGIRYLTAAGYDPYAMASFLDQLQRQAQVEALVSGRPDPAGQFNYLSTHPRTMDRVMEASRAAAGTPGAGDVRDRDTYLRMIDGMVYGDSPSRGFVRGRVFANPDDNIVWEAPPDFVLQRVGEQLVAAGPGDTRILYDTVELGRPVPPLTFLTDMWAANVPLEAVERLEINGFPAATGVFRASTQSGPRDVRPVVIEIAPGQFGRFIFITRPELTGRAAEALRRTTYSYRPLTPAERAALSARQIEVVTVQPGDTIRSLAQRMAFDDYRLERFLALNALDPDDPLEPGRKVKLVVK